MAVKRRSPLKIIQDISSPPAGGRACLPSFYEVVMNKQVQGGVLMSREHSWWLWVCMLGLSLLACCGSKDVNLIDIRAMGIKTCRAASWWSMAHGQAQRAKETADFIGKTFAEGGARVDVKPVQSVKTLAGYHAVVIGNAIRAGKVKPEVMDLREGPQDGTPEYPYGLFYRLYDHEGRYTLEAENHFHRLDRAAAGRSPRWMSGCLQGKWTI